MKGVRLGHRRVPPYLLLLAPATLYVVATTAYPVANTIYISFTDLRWDRLDVRNVGLENYAYLLDWPVTWQSLRASVIFVAWTVALQVLLGLLGALSLNRKARGTGFVRGVAILPWILPGVVVAVLFRLMFSSTNIGIVNIVMSWFGLPAQNWLADPGYAMAILIIAATWHGIGFSLILILAALQTVPKDYYEAAAIDGANRLQELRSITLPLIRPTILFVVIMQSAFNLNEVGIVFGLTRGGPGRATEVLGLSVYQQGFEFFEAGLGSAMAVMLLLINVAMTILYLRVMRGEERPLDA